MIYLNKPVAYLQDFDFNENGDLINDKIPDIPVIIMIQAKFCGHCTNAKPSFQKFAEDNKEKVFCATIEGDGEEKGEKELSERISIICPNFRGFPSYVAYKNKKFIKVHNGGRDIKSLEDLLETIS